jgi:hypothetical protein
MLSLHTSSHGDTCSLKKENVRSLYLYRCVNTASMKLKNLSSRKKLTFLTSLTQTIKSKSILIMMTVIFIIFITACSNSLIISPVSAPPFVGNMTAGIPGAISGEVSSGGHSHSAVTHPPRIIHCPFGEHFNGYRCVSNITNRQISCPSSQHVTQNGFCVSNITNRQISCLVGQRVTVNGICMSSHAPSPTPISCPIGHPTLTRIGRCI